MTSEFEHIDSQFIDKLELTGIIDAYEYVLRKLIQDSLPKEEVYEKCARYLLEYKKLLLENNIRAKNAKSFYELSSLDIGKKEEKKNRRNNSEISGDIALKTFIGTGRKKTTTENL